MFLMHYCFFPQTFTLHQHEHISTKQNLVSTASYYYVLRACNKFQDLIMYLVHVSLQFHIFCALLYEFHKPSCRKSLEATAGIDRHAVGSAHHVLTPTNSFNGTKRWKLLVSEF